MFPGGGGAAIEFRKRSLPPVTGGSTLTAPEVQLLLLKGAFATGNQSSTPPEPGVPPSPILDLAQLAALGILTLGKELWQLLAQFWGKIASQQRGVPGSVDLTDTVFPNTVTVTGQVRSVTYYKTLRACADGRVLQDGNYPWVTENLNYQANIIQWDNLTAKCNDVCGPFFPAPYIICGYSIGFKSGDGNFTPTFESRGTYQTGERGQPDYAWEEFGRIVDPSGILIDGAPFKFPTSPDPTDNPEFIPIPELEPEAEPSKVPVLPERPVIAPPIVVEPGKDGAPGSVPIQPGGVPGIGTGTDTGNTPGAKPLPVQPPVIKPVPIVPVAPPAVVPGTPPVAVTPPGVEFYPDGKPIIGTQVPATLVGIAAEVGRIERKALDIYNKQPSALDLDDLTRWAKWIYDYLSGIYPGGEFKISSPCEFDDDGKLKPPLVAKWEAGSGLAAETQAMITALAELLQHHKTLRQPTCKGKGAGVGEGVTVQFRSLELQPSGKDHLRKVFGYRDQNGGTLEQHTEHWADFKWQAGPWRVQGLGIWGKVEVWAASAAEGKRVIGHAAAIAGIDTTNKDTFEWSIQRTTETRRGHAGTMVIKELRYGDSITKRDGPSGLPDVIGLDT